MDGPRLSGRSLEEAAGLERQDHLVYGRRGDAKVPLHFGLRGCAAVNLAVVIDESQVLTLFVGVGFPHRHLCDLPTPKPYFKRCFRREVSNGRAAVLGSG